jgi:hypothetical protein
MKLNLELNGTFFEYFNIYPVILRNIIVSLVKQTKQPKTQTKMIDISIKQDGLKIKKNTATITVELRPHHNTPQKQLKALAILLGGYNQYGRLLSVLECCDFKERFNDLLLNVVEKLDEAEKNKQ